MLAMSMRAQWWRLARSGSNGVRRLVAGHHLRILTMAITAALMWTLISGLTLGLLELLGAPGYVALKPRMVEAILALFFLALFAFVSASAAVLVWATAYRSRSGAFLATLPLPDGALWWCAAVEGGAWAVWAVVALVVPLLLALASEARQPLLYLPAATIAVLGLIACCLSAGAIGALALARLIPLARRHALPATVAALGLVVLGAIHLATSIHQGDRMQMLGDALARLSFAAHPALPSLWAEEATAAAADGRWADWLDGTCLLWTAAAAAMLAGEALARWRLRADMDALASAAPARARARSRAWRLPPWPSAELALLIVKDLRLFRRDPVQLMQFAAFACLLGFYVLMLPRLGRAFAGLPWWRPMVSVLNLVAVTMALATFCGRFVYPMLALEGRRLWVLALAPFPRTHVVTAKFAVALLIALPTCLGLVALSGLLLGLSVGEIAYQLAVIAALSAALASGALGLGARMADYREDNPAKLVAGYGGTVNLLLSLGLSAGMLGLAACPVLAGASAPGWILVAAVIAALCACWTVFMLRLARRCFLEAGELGA